MKTRSVDSASEEREVRLQAGRERSVQHRHPWIFSGAIATAPRQAVDGEAVDVRAADGRWLARGTWSGSSQLRVRLWTWDADEVIDDALIQARLARAVEARRHLLGDVADAYRLVFSESDGLPGLIADRYGDWVVVQVSTAGIAARLDAVVTALRDVVQPRGIIERSEDDVLRREGLSPARRLLWGDPPPEDLIVGEYDLRWQIDLSGGQKTAAYLDQRENRRRVAGYLAGRDVLSCFSYAGGFELHAARAGASSIIGIDSSAPALAQAERNRGLNEIALPIAWRRANVFEELRRLKAEGQTFDAVILDPPKLVPTRANLDRGLRAYKDLNMQALHLLRPEGILATFSCSGQVSADLFQKVLFGAAIDARRDVQIIERLGQPADHPILLSFPESEYLKGLVCRVL